MQMTATIRQEHFITSIADALQHISFFHPADYIAALGEAYRKEESPAARDGRLVVREAAKVDAAPFVQAEAMFALWDMQVART